MGTGTIAFFIPNQEVIYRDQSQDICIDIGKAVMRSIVEEMEREKPGDPVWKGELDAAYGIDYLYVGVDRRLDFGSAFYRALNRLKETGPPEYYPMRDLQLFYEQIGQLKEQYLRLRPPPEEN